MIRELLVDGDNKLYYSYFDRTRIPNIELEIKRYILYNNLNKKFKSIFNTDVELADIYLICYSKNKNNKDPVICFNLTEKD